MEKQLLLSKGCEATAWMQALAMKAAALVHKPVEMARNYYSKVLGQQVTGGQTWCLLEAQTAFFLGIMPAAYPLTLRAACLVWAVWAAVRCRRKLCEGQTA